MGITRLGDDAGDVVEIDALAKALRMVQYPRDAEQYSVRAGTNILAATLAAGVTIFSMRVADTPGKLCYIRRIWCAFSCTVAFTTGSQLLFTMDRFSTAAPTGGVARPALPHKSGDVTEVTDIRASDTSGLSVAGVVYENNQVPVLSLASPLVSQHEDVVHDYWDNPIILQGGQGLGIRNAVAWPAAGTGIFQAVVDWEER